MIETTCNVPVEASVDNNHPVTFFEIKARNVNPISTIAIPIQTNTSVLNTNQSMNENVEELDTELYLEYANAKLCARFFMFLFIILTVAFILSHNHISR